MKQVKLYISFYITMLLDSGDEFYKGRFSVGDELYYIGRIVGGELSKTLHT